MPHVSPTSPLSLLVSLNPPHFFENRSPLLKSPKFQRNNYAFARFLHGLSSLEPVSTLISQVGIPISLSLYECRDLTYF